MSRKKLRAIACLSFVPILVLNAAWRSRNFALFLRQNRGQLVLWGFARSRWRGGRYRVFGGGRLCGMMQELDCR